MVSTWTAWKAFPDPRQGGQLEAPIGPGIYEVRDTANNAMIAFGASPSVARDLAKLMPGSPRGLLANLFGAARPAVIEKLEYRTWPAATYAEARRNAERLRGRRDVFMRRRAAWNAA
ncbi:MAG TPA: hypothetical protein VHA55_12525 [Pseudorhodoplanes sp.]|jgi:hypothetical protein|nr:hypothetical protein [Pseudorhodoplanes sp.]